MGLKQLLDRHAIPLLAGLAVVALDKIVLKWPAVAEILDAAGISEVTVSAAVIGLASYGLSKLDPIWSNKSWRVQPDSSEK